MEDGDSCHRSGNVNPQITQRYLRLQPKRTGDRFRVASCGFVDRRPRNDNSTIHEITLNTTKFLLLCGEPRQENKVARLFHRVHRNTLDEVKSDDAGVWLSSQRTSYL
ncbi:MAG: hypothetical protein QOI77_1105 [Blastocatellia bacterium]|jgi:hypothetical protein|nr:hypothetical protein [Blastocatellia bacterium]